MKNKKKREKFLPIELKKWLKVKKKKEHLKQKIPLLKDIRKITCLNTVVSCIGI